MERCRAECASCRVRNVEIYSRRAEAGAPGNPFSGFSFCVSRSNSLSRLEFSTLVVVIEGPIFGFLEFSVCSLMGSIERPST